MNAFGFFLSRVAWQLGIRNERARWNSITKETQLLAEAQDLLGKLAWPLCEQIEHLSGEFWQLRDLDAQQNNLRAESDSLTRRNEEAQEKLYGIEEQHEAQIEEMRRRKLETMEKVLNFQEEVAAIREQDTETRRRISSLNIKLDLLKKQQGGDFSSEVDKTTARLKELDDEHKGHMSEIEKREGEIQRIEKEVQRYDTFIAGRREQLRAETSDLVAEIGRLSKQVADLSAKIGAIDSSKSQLSFHVGQYLCGNLDSRDPQVRAVLRRFRPIVSRIKSLRQSVQYNQRMVRRSRR